MGKVQRPAKIHAVKWLVAKPYSWPESWIFSSVHSTCLMWSNLTRENVGLTLVIKVYRILINPNTQSYLYNSRDYTLCSSYYSSHTLITNYTNYYISNTPLKLESKYHINRGLNNGLLNISTSCAPIDTRHEWSSYHSLLNPLTNNMTINLNVFGHLTKHGIWRNTYS